MLTLCIRMTNSLTNTSPSEDYRATRIYDANKHIIHQVNESGNEEQEQEGDDV